MTQSLRERALAAYEQAEAEAARNIASHEQEVRARHLADLDRAIVRYSGMLPDPDRRIIVQADHYDAYPILQYEDLEFVSLNGDSLWLLETCPRCGARVDSSKITSWAVLGAALARTTESMRYHLAETCPLHTPAETTAAS